MTFSRRAHWTSSAVFGATFFLLAPVGGSIAAAAATAVPEANEPQAEPRESAAERTISFSDSLGLSGSVRTAYFSRDKSFSDNIGYAVGSIWVTATPQEFWGIRTYFDGRVQEQGRGSHTHLSWELREGYADATWGNFDLKAGRQIIVWGRADKINPTDVWSTRDFTLLAPNDDDQRLGVTSVQGSWNAGSNRLIAIWQPEWRNPVTPLPPLAPGVSIQHFAPSNRADQFGLRFDHSGEGVDWSTSYAHAIDRTPDLQIIASHTGGALLGFVYRKINMLGADAAVPIGNYGLRGEVAYTRTEDRSRDDPLTKNPNVFLVLGCERTFDGVLNVNLQYLYRRTFDFARPSSIADPPTRELAEQVDLISNQLAANMRGISLRINHKAWNETLETEIAAVVWFEKHDAALRPKITYAFTDRIKGIIGGEIYTGPRTSFFGRLNRTSAGYAELQFGF